MLSPGTSFLRGPVSAPTLWEQTDMASRQMRFIATGLVALLVSNLVLGLLSFVFIRDIDQRYGQLLDRSLPVLNEVRSLSWEVTQVQRSINRFPQYDTPGRTILLAHREMAMARASELLNSIKGRELANQFVDPLQRLNDAQAEIMSASAQWFETIQAGDLATAQQINRTQVQPAYERHARILEQLAVLIEKNGTETNIAVSADAVRSGAIVLAIATWPLAAGLLALALGLVGVFLLMPLVRRFERELRR